MKKIPGITVITISAFLALNLYASTAFADGMPFQDVKPQPILTPLDKALDDIETDEPPVDVTKPAPAPEPIQQEAPKLPPPVPQERVVEVQPNTSYFGLSVGMYDPLTHGKQAAALTAEYRPGVKIAGILQPIFGAMAATNGAVLGYGGVGVPVKLGSRFSIMPSVAVGAYHEGNGYDLDRTLAFRIGAEAAYEFDNKSKLGLNAYIITNGRSTGREDRTEVISLMYTMPTTLLSGPIRKGLTEKTSAPAAPAPTPAAAEAPKAKPSPAPGMND